MYIYVCTHVYIFKSIHIIESFYAYEHIDKDIYMYIYIYTYVYIYIYVCI